VIRLNRTTEYGIMALRHMSRKSERAPAELTSAREIADVYGLPFEITAKTLQRLRDSGLIQSEQGARGGYALSRRLNEVTLAEFLELMEGPQSVVACSDGAPEAHAGGCGYHGKCEIRGVMGELNAKVLKFLGGIRLADFAREQTVPQPTYGLAVGEEP
jgi:Rrf2 family protein